MNLLMLFALALAPAAPVPQAPPMVTAVIVDYGPMPSAGSGVNKVLRPVMIVTAKGEKQTLYFVHASDDRYFARVGDGLYPAVGSACTFSAGMDQVIDEVRCGA
jgi:hypothetical protein